jgi:hypothetical protein
MDSNLVLVIVGVVCLIIALFAVSRLGCAGAAILLVVIGIILLVALDQSRNAPHAHASTLNDPSVATIEIKGYGHATNAILQSDLAYHFQIGGRFTLHMSSGASYSKGGVMLGQGQDITVVVSSGDTVNVWCNGGQTASYIMTPNYTSFLYLPLVTR